MTATASPKVGPPTIEHAVPARVGLLGNPSDSYGGRTIALAIPAFEATVTLKPSRGVHIVDNDADAREWVSAAAFVQHVDRYGTGTGSQAIAAAVRTFLAVLDSLEFGRFDGFTLSYTTTIPRQVGLAGSSALVLATMKCLEEHTGIDVPRDVLPSLALAAETDHLGVVAGLQDRVVQTYGGLVAMDFGEMSTDARFGVSYGEYYSLDASRLPSLFLAYANDAAEPSGTYHKRLRHRYDSGDQVVRSGMRQLAAVAVEGEAALRWGNTERFGELIGRTMELRRSFGPLPEKQLALVERAESLDTFATFAGSGGAVVGVYSGADQLRSLTALYASVGAAVVDLVEPEASS